MDYGQKFSEGLTYDAFLEKYATPDQLSRWKAFDEKVELTEAQTTLLGSFVREMKVLVLAGAWCGDCVNQCPILNRFARANEKIQIRYFDRDDHDDLASELTTCGGKRVPSVLFLSEDNYVCGRYGDRTLSKYREVAAQVMGASCPSGIVFDDETDAEKQLRNDVIQEWLDQFERIQLMLRTSGRLRQLHND